MTKSMILSCGPTGSTGGATARQLLKEGHAIRVLAHREDDRSKLLQDLGAEVVYGDLLDIHAVTAAFRRRSRRFIRRKPAPARDGEDERDLRSGRQGDRGRDRGEHVDAPFAPRHDEPCAHGALALRARPRLRGHPGHPPTGRYLLRVARVPVCPYPAV